MMADPYKEGREAFGKGLTLDDNPYQDEPEKRDKWNSGWEDAKIEGDFDTRSICREKP